MAQAFAKAFYKSKKWRKCRAAFVASRVNIDGGLCQICRDAPGYIVHHKVWLTPENITDPDIALNPANFLYATSATTKSKMTVEIFTTLTKTASRNQRTGPTPAALLPP